MMFKVDDSSRTPEARNAARRMAQNLGFDEAAAERAAIVTTEACTNLLKHAGGGTVLLAENGEDLSMEMFALDRGPGMLDWNECLRDGYTTTGTSGNGLGAIARLSAFSDAYSQAGRGTVLFALLTKDENPKAAAPRICGVQAPKPGQEVCGDGWSFKKGRAGAIVVLADGLGHGPDAAEAARCAIEIFHRHTGESPKELLESIHQGLRHTRGAAVSVAETDEERRTVVFAGLGNVAGYVCEKGAVRRQLITMNGTAGMDGRNVFREFSYPWPEEAVLVLHSDGLVSHWDLGDYPALITRGPSLIVGVLFRDCCRGNDDATVMAAI
jgi:anti-sigma regulatory factor (Ser/Thr protein kinase)